jgi:hypothetical protein
MHMSRVGVLGAIGVLYVVLVAGCARTVADFRPYSATSVKQPVTERAVFAYPGDVGRLRKRGAELVGSIYVGGNGFATRDDVRDRALEQAAALGGTHVFIRNEQSSTVWAQTTPDRATTYVRGNTATTLFQPGMQVPITKFSGDFIVVRVLPERWSGLPAPLRPRPNTIARRMIARASDDPYANSDDEGRDDAQLTEASTEPAHSTPDSPWYCQDADDGRCYRTAEQCRAADTEETCDAESVAFCASWQDRDDATDETTLRCYGTDAACRTGRDGAFADGADIMHECAESR